MNRVTVILIGLIWSVISVNLSAQAPAGFYSSIINQKGETLQKELFKIIKGHTKKSYDYLWTAFYTTDSLQPGNKVWDIYSHVPAPGVSPYLFLLGTSQCTSTPGYEGGCYNREHTFPKSWWNSTGNSTDTMYTDLFHIMPTDSYVNSRRNNNPYGEVNSPTWTSQNGGKLGPCSTAGFIGATSDVVFEPIDEFKGDVARNYFYMATRYFSRIASWASMTTEGDLILNGTSYPAYEAWYVDLMLKWHHMDPVSQKEIDRNNAVYQIQGNRNPYIDHPEWADWVWDPEAILPEPSNYPNPFSATTIHLMWKDAVGDVIPMGYLIRWSAVGYDAIETPVDGVQVTDGGNSLNVAWGIQQAMIPFLIPQTDYYFKIFPYTGAGSHIDYKTDGVVPMVMMNSGN